MPKLLLTLFSVWHLEGDDQNVQCCSIWVEAARRAHWYGCMCNLLARLGDIDTARRKALLGLQHLGAPMPQAVAPQPSDLARKISWLAFTCLNPLCVSPPEASTASSSSLKSGPRHRVPEKSEAIWAYCSPQDLQNDPHQADLNALTNLGQGGV